jgi:predicted nucleic acid-binding protein
MDATHSWVYVETSIPSFYFTLRTDPESIARMHWTRRWWAEYATRCMLTTSAAVIDELRRGTGERTEDRIGLLANAIVLPITEEVIRIARVYIDRRVMPQDPQGDALHLALASYHKADFLLTWNCQHLANASKFQQIRLVNYELGLATPVLATPLNFGSTEGTSDERL